MRTAIGILLMGAGIAFGIYVGVWLCFIGGIVQIADAVKATPISAIDIGWGALRIIFAGFAGVMSAIVAVFPGFAMLQR